MYIVDLKNDSPEECVICLGTLITQKPLFACPQCHTTACHLLCILEWLQNKSTCPLCNHELDYTNALHDSVHANTNTNTSVVREPQPIPISKTRKLASIITVLFIALMVSGLGHLFILGSLKECKDRLSNTTMS
jgi:E3 ubiquitin-protein ligase DOA10